MATAQRTRIVFGARCRAVWQLKPVSRNSVSALFFTIIACGLSLLRTTMVSDDLKKIPRVTITVKGPSVQVYFSEFGAS